MKIQYPADFMVAIEILLGHEGGYVWHKDDPGGETNWGISKRSYPHVDIKNLTREGAMAIYYKDFWLPVVDSAVMHLSVAIQLMDAAVNHGIPRAKKLLQQAVFVKDDGIIGPLTLAAVAMSDHNDILLRFLGFRTKFFIGLNTFPSFGRGWMDRIANNLIISAQFN